MKFYQLLLENTAINAEQVAGIGTADYESWFQEQVKTALIGYDATQTAQVMNILGNVINKFKKMTLADVLGNAEEASIIPTIDTDTELVYRVDPTPKNGRYFYTGTGSKDIIKLERGVDVDVIDSNPKWKSALDKGYLFWINVFNLKKEWVQEFIHDLIGIYKYATTPTKEITADYVTKIKELKDPDAQKNAFAELKKSSQNYSKRVQQAAKNLIGALIQVKPAVDMAERAKWMIGELKDEHEAMFKEVLPSLQGSGLEKIYASENGEVIWKITNKFASLKEGNALRNCIGTYYEFNDEAGAFTTGGSNIDPDDYRNMYDIYVLKDERGKTTTAFRMASHADYPTLFEIKGYNNHPPDPYHGKTIMNWLNSNKSLEVDDSAKEDLIGGGIVQLEDGNWGTFLDKAEFEVIDTLSNGDQITIIKNVEEFDKRMARKMFALDQPLGLHNTVAYQVRDPKGAVKWVMNVQNKVLTNFCKPGKGFNDFKHISTPDVHSHVEALKKYWPTFIEKDICSEVNSDMEDTILSATGNIIDDKQIIQIEAKWPHDLIKEVEGIKIFKVTAPTNKMYYDHRYHEMYQGDKGDGDSYTDHDHVFQGDKPDDQGMGYFLLSQNNKFLYAVRYDKRGKTIVPTITAQGTDTDSGLPLESGVIINPKIRKEVTHAIAWLSKDHHGTEQHTDFPQDPDLVDTDEYWEHYGKNIMEVVSGLVSLGPKMTNLKMNRILGQPLNIVLQRWDQISESMQDRILEMFTTSDYQITAKFSDKDGHGKPPKTHPGEGWILIQNRIRFPHNKDTLETFHKTPLKAFGMTLGKQFAQQLININKRLLTDKRYASFEINDDEGDIDDVLRIVSQGGQSTVDIISKLYAQLNSYYESIHEKILRIEEQVGWGTDKALKTIIPYMSRRKGEFPKGDLKKLLYQLGPGMPAESRVIEMDVKTKWLTPTTFTLPNWDLDDINNKIVPHAMLTIDMYETEEAKKGWGSGGINTEKKYINTIDPKTGVIDIGTEPVKYYYHYRDSQGNNTQISKEAKDGIELNAKMEVETNPKNVEYVKNTDNFKMPYFSKHDDVDPYGHSNFTYEIKVFSRHASHREHFWREFVRPLDHVITKNIALCDTRMKLLKNSRIQSASNV